MKIGKDRISPEVLAEIEREIAIGKPKPRVKGAVYYLTNWSEASSDIRNSMYFLMFTLAGFAGSFSIAFIGTTFYPSDAVDLLIYLFLYMVSHLCSFMTIGLLLDIRDDHE